MPTSAAVHPGVRHLGAGGLMPVDAPLYPVNLVVAGRRCLVVGGGRVAAQKARELVACGAEVHVVAPRIDPDTAAVDGVSCHTGPTGGRGRRLPARRHRHRRPAVNHQVFLDGEGAGVWVNSADDPANCAFTLPSRVRQGPLLVTFSTGGDTPALATWLRRRFGGRDRPGVPRPDGVSWPRSAPACRATVSPPRASTGRERWIRGCWNSSARVASPKPRSASRRVCRRHRTEPPHGAARPARADDHRRRRACPRRCTT